MHDKGLRPRWAEERGHTLEQAAKCSFKNQKIKWAPEGGTYQGALKSPLSYPINLPVFSFF